MLSCPTLRPTLRSSSSSSSSSSRVRYRYRPAGRTAPSGMLKSAPSGMFTRLHDQQCLSGRRDARCNALERHNIFAASLLIRSSGYSDEVERTRPAFAEVAPSNTKPLI